MAHEEQKPTRNTTMELAVERTTKGDADYSDKGEQEETASYRRENNPFSLLYQPPSKFSTYLEEVSQPSTESSVGFHGFANYLKKFQGQRVCEKELILSLSKEQPVSNQITQYDVSGFPVAAPLCNLESVLSWETGQDELCVPTVPLQERSPDPFDACNLIVCHDMMGGYLNDRFAQGHSGSDGYVLYHWQHISAFIYFSHHFISIPPPCWTNAAHRHGVRVLGTVITEWQEGAKISSRILGHEETIQTFAQQLVSIAQYYRFDGWLVNIENPIHPSHVDSLCLLLMLLTTGMHEVNPGSKVIWYDSVTKEGELKYQNTLNENNKEFFTICDGIFLNYSWTIDNLRESHKVAGPDAPKVFVGIDVFGRGCFGGGGYNTNIALEVIHGHGLSAALFAPGWVYENNDRETFIENQNKFWTLLAPFCTTHPISSLPLVSSFSRGFGEHVTIDGKVVLNKKWINLSSQDVQLSFSEYLYKNDPMASVQIHMVELDHKVSYNNGSSLVISGSISDHVTPSTCPANVRLFRVNNIQFSKPLVVCYTYYTKSSSLKHVLRLRTSSFPKYILLDPTATVAGITLSSDAPPCTTLSVLPATVPSPLDSSLLGPLCAQYADTLHHVFTGHGSDTTDSCGWKTSYFIVAMSGAHTLQGMSLSLWSNHSRSDQGTDFSLHVGEIKIIDAECVSTKNLPSTICSLECIDPYFNQKKQALSLTLTWQSSGGKLDPIDHCNVFAFVTAQLAEYHGVEIKPDAGAMFLGKAYSNHFRVVDFILPFVSERHDAQSHSVALEFRVQPVTISRQKLPVPLTHRLRILLSE